jgi:hypothetical protein
VVWLSWARSHRCRPKTCLLKNSGTTALSICFYFYLFLRSTQHQETTVCLPCFAFSHYTFLGSRSVSIICCSSWLSCSSYSSYSSCLFCPIFSFSLFSLLLTFNPSPSLLIVDHSTIVRANPYLLSLLSINVVPEKEEREEREEEEKTAPEHVPMKRRSQTAP